MTATDSITDRIGARRAEMVEDLRRCVAIPTGHDHRPGLDELRAFFHARLTALGATRADHPGRERPSWLLGGGSGQTPPETAVFRCEGFDRMEGPRVLIAGHLDTVFPPDGPFQSMEIADDGATAVGPGVVDMKGGLLVALYALEALHEAGVKVRWSYSLNSDEETGTYCSEHTLIEEAKRHDVGIALEPALPGGALAIARKGSGQFKVEVRGKSAHAGREFEKGVSAVYAMARTLTAIEGMSDLESGLTVNVGPVRGGTATNVVPDLCEAWGNARFPVPELSERLQSQLVALESGGTPQITVHRSFNRPAKPETPAVRRLAELAREEAEALGQTLPFESTGGVCDGNVLQAAGLPTIDTMGVRGGNLHRHDEWIELDSLTERASLMARLLTRLHTDWGTDAP
ncbi:MAG: M20/M25/M40 family metallo-hydrolase [Planctomycetota bacterium]